MTHYFFIKYKYPKGTWQIADGIFKTETLAKLAVADRKIRFRMTEEAKICKCWRRDA